MFISIFKNNQPLSLIVFSIIFIGLWIPAFIYVGPIPYNNTMPLYEFYARGGNAFPLFHTLFAIVLIVGEGFLLNYFVNMFEIMAKKTYMPAIFYCLLMSSCQSMLKFYPLLFSNLFILLALLKIGHSYRENEAFSSFFDASLFIGIASLFYFPSIIIFPLIWVALIVIRPFVWREWVISLIGVSLPYLFTLMYYFWFDKLNYLLYDKIFFPSSDVILNLSSQRESFIAVAVMLIILLVLSLLRLMIGWPVNTILSRNLLVVLLWLLGLSLLSYTMAPLFNIRYLATAAIPLAVLIANYFLMSKRVWIAEVLFLCFVGALFYECYNR